MLKNLILYTLFFGLVAVLAAPTFLYLYGAAWWLPAIMLIVPALGLGVYLHEDGRELRDDFRFWWRYERPFHPPSDLPPY
jgi:hypothetical protein